MLKIGVTGSSGSGKTAICKMLLDKLNAKVIDADCVVKRLQNQYTEYYKKIVENFGQGILLEDGSINRKALGNIVFNDEAKLKVLNELTGKYVGNEINFQIEALQKENYKYIIIDAPTLIETGMVNIFDKIIVVNSDFETKINRICSRDNITKEQAKMRLNAQKEDEFYEKYADIIVINNDDIEKAVQTIIEKLEEN